MPIPQLLADVLIVECELDEAQRMNERARETYIGKLPPIRTALDRHQSRIDVQRIRIKAAKQYLQSTSK